jgi:cell wall-associated NlpC family hydrolase
LPAPIASKFWDETLYLHALSYLHTPYIIGGEFPHPDFGMDCSGFVIDLLQGAGVLPHKYDNTAQGLMADLLAMPGTRQGVYGLGSVVFWGPSPREIQHVDFMLDVRRIIGAIGGDSTTKALAAAAAKDARIKIRTIKYRSGMPMIVRPSYVAIGETP